MRSPGLCWVVALAVCAALAVLSILFVDRGVAEFAAAHEIQLRGLRIVGASPGAMLPVALALPMIGLFWRGIRMRAPRLWRVLTLCSVSVIWTAAAVELVLKPVFGRLGPYAWLERHDYGFHWLAGREAAFPAFPSGEAALTMAAVSVLWLCYPRWRWLFVLAAEMEAFLLVDLNWHFLSDVVAGGMIGAFGGAIARELFRRCDDSAGA